MQGLATNKGVHVGDNKIFLFVHKNHMTPQIPSCISKVVATNNFERLIPWSWLIQNGLQLEYHAWFQICNWNIILGIK
jgi:hypothetical protein